jgi:deazaflavin-dependent oxidoreductase (nitroreductase family)
MEFSMQGNDFVKILLLSPLHGLLGNSLMLITVRGRKSGRAITTPVNYYSDGESLWVISNRNRKWWRNVCEGAEVTLRLNGRDVKAHAESILDEHAVANQIGEYVQHLPMTAKPLGVRLQNGVADIEDTQRLAKEKLFVKICIE